MFSLNGWMNWFGSKPTLLAENDPSRLQEYLDAIGVKNPERPCIKLFTDDTSIELVGEHNPQDLATLLLLFSKGEMSNQLSDALIKNGVSDEWVEQYQKAAHELIKKETKPKKEKPEYVGPVVSALEAFR